MNRDKLKILCAMLIFGTIGPVRRAIPLPSSVVACARALIGALFLGGVMLFKRRKPDIALFKKNAPLLLVSGILLGANWILLFEAYRYTSVAVATVCYYMAPMLVIAVSPLLFHEKLTLKKGLCALVALIGIVLVSNVNTADVGSLTGILFGLGAAVMYAVIVIINKKLVGLSADDRTVCQLGIAALSLLPYVFVTESVPALSLSGIAVLWLLLAGILHTGIAYRLYFGSMAAVPSQTVALLSYADPVFALLLSALVLGETLTLPALIGAILVIGASLVSEIHSK